MAKVFYNFAGVNRLLPLEVWLVTSPLWAIMVVISVIEIFEPQMLDSIYQMNPPRSLSILYGISTWYIWLVFTLAFGSGAAANYIPFYNIPAFVLFLAGAVGTGIAWWRKRVIV